MIYCMSDIHGEKDRFDKMLDLIHFSDSDTLYIIGDVIDRGPSGIEIMKFIMECPNIVLIIGNHEDICLKTLGPQNEFGARDIWRSNGGSHTYREMVYHMSPAERRKILRYIESSPIQREITVAGQKYHLVHGWPGSTEDDKIWGRPMDNTPSILPADATAIIGHTPTCFLAGEGEEPFHIIHRPEQHYIDIDCGAGHLNFPDRSLACLRLDDMAEFYV